MRAVPDGMITFEVASELPRSLAETLLAYNSVGSIFTITARVTPPRGAGDEKPGIVKSCNRIKLNA